MSSKSSRQICLLVSPLDPLYRAIAAVKRTSILYASFFGGKLFSDDRLPQKLIGGALIIASGFIILRNVA